MLYKIINSDIMLSGKIFPEGSEIELTEKDSDSLKNYLEPITEIKKHNNISSTKQLNKKEESLSRAKARDLKRLPFDNSLFTFHGVNHENRTTNFNYYNSCSCKS
jgi:hypothetical protein